MDDGPLPGNVEVDVEAVEAALGNLSEAENATNATAGDGMMEDTMFSYVFEGILLSAVTAFGLIANTIAVIVLTR